MKARGHAFRRRTDLTCLAVVGLFAFFPPRLAVERTQQEQAASHEKRYQEWVKTQSDPRAGDEDKAKSTVASLFRIVFDGWLAGELGDLGFLFDQRLPAAVSDCAFERDFYDGWLREWKGSGVKLSKDIAEDRILSSWVDGDRAKVRAEPSGRYPYPTPGMTDVPRPLGEHEFRLVRRGGQWLIAGISKRSYDFPRFLWQVGQKGMEDRGTVVVKTESLETGLEHERTKRGEPDVGERRAKRNKFLEMPHTISLEDIKERLKPWPVGKITLFDKRYAIAETIRPKEDNWFYLFDLVSGEMEFLPTAVNYARLYRIESPDRIGFLADGRNTINADKAFPLTIVCARPGEGRPFADVREPRYLPLDQRAEFGIKSPAVVLDVKVTIGGLEASFGPEEGDEQDFYAGYSDIPVTRTEYVAEKNQFVVTFKDTSFPESPGWAPALRTASNDYVASVEWDQSGDDARLMISLRNGVLFYRGYKLTVRGESGEAIDDLGPDIPFVRLTFYWRKPAWYER